MSLCLSSGSWTTCNYLAVQQALRRRSKVAVSTIRNSSFNVFADLVELHLLDVECALIFFKTITREHLHVDDGTFHAGWNTQRSVFHIRGFFTEDRTQQFFFRRQLGFAFGRHFTDQNIAGFNFRTDIDDTGFIQTCSERFHPRSEYRQ